MLDFCFKQVKFFFQSPDSITKLNFSFVTWLNVDQSWRYYIKFPKYNLSTIFQHSFVALLLNLWLEKKNHFEIGYPVKWLLLNVRLLARKQCTWGHNNDDIAVAKLESKSHSVKHRENLFFPPWAIYFLYKPLGPKKPLYHACCVELYS